MRKWLFRIGELRKHRLFRWGMNALVSLLVVLGISAWQARHHVRGNAPAFSLSGLEGPGLSSADLSGKPTMLVFWAPWCTVCALESGNVSRVQRWTSGRANVVSIASDYPDLGSVQNYVERHGVDYPVLLGGKRTARAFRVSVFPTIYFLDGAGRITRSVAGYTSTFGLMWRLFL